MTPDDFRRLVLQLPGAIEGAHMGHPDFRANGRIFASLHTKDTFGMVALSPEEQREVLRANPETFEPSAGAWGRQGATNVRLAVADPAAVRGALTLAWDRAKDLGKANGGARKAKGKPQKSKRRTKAERKTTTASVRKRR
jgi:hypothetical protein